MNGSAAEDRWRRTDSTVRWVTFGRELRERRLETMESIWGAGVDDLVDKRTKCSIAVDRVSVDIAAVRTGRLRRMKVTDEENR